MSHQIDYLKWSEHYVSRTEYDKLKRERDEARRERDRSHAEVAKSLTQRQAFLLCSLINSQIQDGWPSKWTCRRMGCGPAELIEAGRKLYGLADMKMSFEAKDF